MELVISIFIGLWIAGAAVAAYFQLKKEFKKSNGGAVSDEYLFYRNVHRDGCVCHNQYYCQPRCKGC